MSSSRDARLQGGGARLPIGLVVLVLVVLVPGLLGQWAVAYVVNLVSLVTLPVVWVAAMTVGMRQRRPALFMLGMALPPVVALVALAASLGEPPGRVSIVELPLTLGMYLTGPISVAVLGSLVLQYRASHRAASPTWPPPPPPTWPPPPPPPGASGA